MMFRKIYWVVEETRHGKMRLKGVFTSVNDLSDKYLETLKGDLPEAVRITLTKLDAPDGALGVWESPNFDNLRDELDQFVKTGEFSVEDCDRVERLLAGAYN